jgi:hypothetical protein
MMSPIYLDDNNDDVAIIDGPLPEQGPPLSPQLHLSSSPSSSSFSCESSSDPPSSPSPIVKIENDPFDMTGISVHQFPSYRNLQSWMKEYAHAAFLRLTFFLAGMYWSSICACTGLPFNTSRWANAGSNTTGRCLLLRSTSATSLLLYSLLLSLVRTRRWCRRARRLTGEHGMGRSWDTA